jgi:hypothetical protein
LTEKGCGYSTPPITVKEESVSEDSDGCDLVPTLSPGRAKLTKEAHVNHSSSFIEAEVTFDDGSIMSEDSMVPSAHSDPSQKTIQLPIITIDKCSPIYSSISQKSMHLPEISFVNECPSPINVVE